MSDKQKYHVAIAYGTNIPQIAIPLDDKVSAAQTAVFLAENLKRGMTVIVDGKHIESGQAVSYEQYKQLFTGHPIGKYRELPTGEALPCDGDGSGFCRHIATIQAELNGAYYEHCYSCHVDMIKETGAILRHVAKGWEIDGGNDDNQ